MLNDATGFSRIFLKLGYTDLRKGIPGLTLLIRESFGLDPYEKNTLFLFCGRRADRIKGLCFEGDGFCLLSEKNYYSRYSLKNHINHIFFKKLLE